jgi:hypothetical protein
VTAVGDEGMTLELIEEQPSGEVGFEGTVLVSRTGGIHTNGRPVASAGTST